MMPFLLSLIGLFLGQVPNEVPTELVGESEEWLQAKVDHFDGMVSTISAAYELDPDTQDSLRIELWKRATLEKQFQKDSMAEMVRLHELTQGVRGDAPQIQEAMKSLQNIAQSNPLNEEGVVKWIEERLPPAVVAAGRPRLKELQQRRAQVDAAWEQDQERMSARGANLSNDRMSKEARQTFGGNPMPAGQKAQAAQSLDQNQMMQAQIHTPQEAQQRMLPPAQAPSAVPQQSTRAEANKPARPQPAVASVRAAEPVYAPAPPLDDWDKYVADVSRKYNFDEPQRTNAQSILQDLRRRATQYRMSRADQFARAETMKDQKARGDTLRTLSRPIDALFDELKARLENLPTIEQKQRSGQTNAPKSTKGRR
jgi:hypothetical protein